MMIICINVPAPGTPPAPALGTPEAPTDPEHPEIQYFYKNLSICYAYSNMNVFVLCTLCQNLHDASISTENLSCKTHHEKLAGFSLGGFSPQHTYSTFTVHTVHT